MPRPQSFDKFQILDDIMLLVLEVGYEAASVKLICEYVGITRSSFYNAFGSREQMFGQVIEHYQKQSFDLAFALARPPVSARTLVSLVFLETAKTLAGAAAPKGCLLANAIAELNGRNQTLSPVLTHIVEAKIKQLEMILRWGVASKELPQNFDCAAAALSIQNSLFGLTIMGRAIVDAKQLEQLVAHTLRALDLFDETATTLV